MKFNLNDNLNLKVKDTRKAQNTYGSGLMATCGSWFMVTDGSWFTV